MPKRNHGHLRSLRTSRAGKGGATTRRFLAVLFFAALAAAGRASAADPPLTIAVVNFQELGSVRGTGAGALCAEALMDFLEGLPEFQLTERRLLSATRGEQRRGFTGELDERTVARMGRTAGARAVVTGTVSRLERTVYVNARVVDVETARVLSAGRVWGDSIDGVMGKVAKLAADLSLRKHTEPASRFAGARGRAGGNCWPQPPPDTVVVACGQPAGVVLRLGGQLYDFAQKPFLCLPEGSTPFELEVPGAARAIYGRFDVLQTGPVADGVTFGLKNGGLFKPEHLDAVLQGRPVRYTMGVRTPGGSREQVVRYTLSLRPLGR